MPDPDKEYPVIDNSSECNNCQNCIADEHYKLIELIERVKHDYLVYRGSSMDKDGNLMWAKDDAWAYAEGMDRVVELIKDRMPKVEKMSHNYDPSCICLNCHKIWLEDAAYNHLDHAAEEELDSDF